MTIRDINKREKVKKSFRSKERHTLLRVIYDDLIRFGKKPLCLLILIIITAIAVITTIHRTRLLITQREKLTIELNALDTEWRNLIIEENALGDHGRIERLATEKLRLQHIKPSQENIIVQNKGKHSV